MKATLRIDPDACFGSGLCVSTRPDLFRFDDGQAVAVVTELKDPDLITAAQDVAECCPSEAISVALGP